VPPLAVHFSEVSSVSPAVEALVSDVVSSPVSGVIGSASSLRRPAGFTGFGEPVGVPVPVSAVDDPEVPVSDVVSVFPSSPLVGAGSTLPVPLPELSHLDDVSSQVPPRSVHCSRVSGIPVEVDPDVDPVDVAPEDVPDVDPVEVDPDVDPVDVAPEDDPDVDPVVVPVFTTPGFVVIPVDVPVLEPVVVPVVVMMTSVPSHGHVSKTFRMHRCPSDLHQ
jgi:hypothetical protein